MTDTQDRDQQILSRLAKIEHKIDSIDQTGAFAMRADETKHLESVDKVIGKSRRRAQVYLAANGARSVDQIAHHLRMKAPNVSTELTSLGDGGLLELTGSIGNRNLWSKKAIERTLRISRYLEKKFGLGADGAVAKKRKKKRGRR